MIDTRAVAERIWEYEYYTNGFNKLSGADVTILNVRISKSKEKVLADVVLTPDIESGHSERYSDCLYSFSVLGL